MFSIDAQNLYPREFNVTLPKQIAQSARAKDIRDRSRLDSSDGKILDEHDQFYRDHKLLLLLFRVIITKQFL